MKIDPKDGIQKAQLLATENHKIFSVLLLNTDDPTLNMTRSAEPSAKQTLILGCNRGFILKFEKEDPAAEWVKTGETRVEQVVSDLL